MVADGTVTLLEVEEVVDTGQHLSTNHFVQGLPDPKFAMDSEF
jgi:hypothetical protein